MARREPALARAAGIDQLLKVGAVMDTKMVVVRPLGEQNGRYDQPTQRQFPEGLDGGARQEIYSGCMGRVASRSHRCSYKLINVGCMVPARDLDVGEYLKVILHRAACAETVCFDAAPRFDAGSPRVPLSQCRSTRRDVCIRDVCVDTLLPGQVDRLWDGS